MLWKRTQGLAKLQRDSLKHRDDRLVSNALRVDFREARNARGEPSIRDISVTLRRASAFASLVPRSCENASRKARGFFKFCNISVTFCNMDGEHRKSMKTQFALALAQGVSGAKWAKANGVTE